MYKKSIVRRLCNYLPQSIELAKAIHIDSLGEAKSQNLEKVLEGEYSVVEEDIPESVDITTGEIIDHPPESESNNVEK